MEKINKKNVCEICGKTPSEIHHILGRKQGLLNDQLYFIELCNDHHQKHSRIEVLKMIFDRQVQKFGTYWLNRLIQKVQETGIHKPKEADLAYSMLLYKGVHYEEGIVNLSEDYEGD